MNWILSVIFMVIGLVLLFFGYKYKNIEATFIGYVFILGLGVGIIFTGIELPIGYLIG